MFYLGISDSHENQARIIRALTRKFPLEADFDIDSLALQCPLSYTGADFYAVCSDAMLAAMSRAVDSVNSSVGE